MSDDIIKRKELYEGTVCEIVKSSVLIDTIVPNKAFGINNLKKSYDGYSVDKREFDHVVVNFVRDSRFIKVDDNLYYDILEDEFLNLLPSYKVAKEHDEGCYLIYPFYLGDCKPSFSFKEEDGFYEFVGDKQVARKRVDNNVRR